MAFHVDCPINPAARNTWRAPYKLQYIDMFIHKYINLQCTDTFYKCDIWVGERPNKTATLLII